MSRVIHFEILVQDPTRAQKFYSDVFGWSFKQWGNNPYWLATTGDESKPGINGALVKQEQDKPTQNLSTNAFVSTIGVENIDESITLIQNSGGTIVKDKQDIPQVGFFAYAKDTEGNVFGIMQSTQKL